MNAFKAKMIIVCFICGLIGYQRTSKLLLAFERVFESTCSKPRSNVLLMCLVVTKHAGNLDGYVKRVQC